MNHPPEAEEPSLTDADLRLMAVGSSGMSSTAEAWSTNSLAQKRGKPLSRVWLAVAAGLFGLGSIGSAFGAHAIAHTDAQSSRQAFATSAKDISLRLEKSLQHEQDLSFSASAFVVGNQNASQAEFRNWASALHAFARYPELLAIAVLVMVPASQLATFTAREIEDPPGPLAPNGGISISPSGIRPYYCLESVSEVRAGSTDAPAGIDYCKTALGPQLLSSRDSGKDAYLPYGSGKNVDLAVGTPIYLGGIVPSTVAGRQAAFIGWTGTQIRPSVLLSSALEDHRGTAVVFRFVGPSSSVAFEAGAAPKGAQSMSIGLASGWTVQVSAAVSGNGIFVNQNSFFVLLAGLTLSLLLALLFFVLGTSRSRAVVLVNSRTDQLNHLAFHDSLTGLPNRALILDRLGQMMARARREGNSVAAIFLDIDEFKEVNDTLGHSAGDELLVGVSARLAKALRQGDSVGRLGGDEFVVLVDEDSLAARASVVADRILSVLRAPFEIAASTSPLTITASIGIATGTRAKAEDLLRDADIALYRAKVEGKDRAAVFSSPMQDAVEAHRNLELDLRRAAAEGQFFVLYQPTVMLATGAVTGVEALVRWRHPVRGLVGPDEFIPMLESTGLIKRVGTWVLEVACHQAATWASQGHLLTMAVNISSVQLDDDGVVESVNDALVSSGLDPALLILELTETTLMHDVQSTADKLKSLKATGVRIAIDDFGTGYSSLAYLRQFPIDILKIDQSFVAGLLETTESAAIVHTLVQLGKLLGLTTVAEGIETNDQWATLQAEEVDFGQGFLLSRPIEAEAIVPFLEVMAERTEQPLTIARQACG
jgi:diguanylate cyclase (GGDEF)-like protein